MKSENHVYYSKTRVVKSPERGTSLASGIDMFVPIFDEKFISDFKSKNPDISTMKPGCFEYKFSNFNKSILIAPGARIIIPSGIIWKGKSGLSMNMHNKSGVATKLGLVYGAEVVDVDYTGETHISIINTSNYIVEVTENQKLIQILQEPVIIDTPIETALDDVINIESDRGDSWQGSTDNK